jgi:hypothetical protein
MRIAFVAPALILLGACMVGATGKSYAPATGPAGAMVDLELNDKKKVSGELLAVEDSTLLLLWNQDLFRVPVDRIRRGHAPKVSFTGRTLNGDLRERLRLISRYPQGVSSELEARLLEVYEHPAIRSIS